MIKADIAGTKEEAAHTALSSYMRGHLKISFTELIKVWKVLGHKSSYGYTDPTFMCMLNVILFVLQISEVLYGAENKGFKF